VQFAYYPGCSAHATAREYDESARAVAGVLGIELNELADWNCCGSSSAAHTNPRLSTALSLRNLVLAEESGADLATICAFCFNRLRSSKQAAQREPGLKQAVEEVVGGRYVGNATVRHLLDIIAHDVGSQALRNRVERPLEGLKAATYYGCLLVRPHDVTGFDDPEHPTSMDEVLRAVGAETVQWSYKTECCGGGLSITRRDLAGRLVNTLMDRAAQAGATCLVTACPLCFANLETRANRRSLPVFYFTELLGLAFGINDARRWFGRHLISPTRLLRSLELI